jgi:hypothetical protein
VASNVAELHRPGSGRRGLKVQGRQVAAARGVIADAAGVLHWRAAAARRVIAGAAGLHRGSAPGRAEEQGRGLHQRRKGARGVTIGAQPSSVGGQQRPGREARQIARGPQRVGVTADGAVSWTRWKQRPGRQAVARQAQPRRGGRDQGNGPARPCSCPAASGAPPAIPLHLPFPPRPPASGAAARERPRPPLAVKAERGLSRSRRHGGVRGARVDRDTAASLAAN